MRRNFGVAHFLCSVTVIFEKMSSNSNSDKPVAAAASGVPASNPEQVLQALFGKNPSAAARGHDFWDTQPVPKHGQSFATGENQPIENKSVQQVRATPYNLAGPYEWIECDVTDDRVIQDVYDLLNQNYVEDDDAMFRFDYSKEFLRWALTPPGFKKEWHVGVRVKETGKLVAFITAIPATVHVYKKYGIYLFSMMVEFFILIGLLKWLKSTFYVCIRNWEVKDLLQF
jgi:glycylpeptide N-tetradecanoyltransferase